MMDKSSPLDSVRISRPCPASWDAMKGDDQVRHCGECRLNVYNLSAMTRAEAEGFVAKIEGRRCLRYFQRPGGSIITRDCAELRRSRSRRLAAYAVGLFLTTLCAGETLISINTARPPNRPQVPNRAGAVSRFRIAQLRSSRLARIPVITGVIDWVEDGLYPAGHLISNTGVVITSTE